MDGARFIRTLRLKNFLSYGGDSVEIPLEPLNVLIGSNASGKSNLIEAIALLRATPTDLPGPIRQGGGIGEWLWKGGGETPTTEIEATVSYPDGIMPLRYRINFTQVGQRMQIVDEAIENEKTSDSTKLDVYFFYRFQHGHPVLNVRTTTTTTTATDASDGERERIERSLRREDLDPEQSVLSQRKDPDQYPELTYLAKNFGAIRLYREWNLGRRTEPRVPQQADLPGDFLEEDAKNLALVINDLFNRPQTRQRVLTKLKLLYEGVENISTKIQGGTVQLIMNEKGDVIVPATRLSDGTLRYLSLLSILCHDSPPPLVCIEEPELGLHPDILPTIAELLLETSQRTQLVVTTHSDVLVSALTDVPESIVVCERTVRGSELRRLGRGELKEWLEKYTLGELWRMGEIGGTP